MDYIFKLNLMAVFVSALSLSLGHCMGMCGGIVLSYTQIKNPKHIGIAHIFYNLGRLCSYICIGLIFAILGHGILYTFVRDIASFIVGGLLIVYAVCFAFFPKILHLFEPNIAKLGFFGKVFSFLLFSPHFWSYFCIGIFNGFLPCGLVYFFALSVLNVPNFEVNIYIGSILIMSVFWVATLIPMLGVGILSDVLKRYRKIFFWASFLCMIGFGLLNIYQGLTRII